MNITNIYGIQPLSITINFSLYIYFGGCCCCCEADDRYTASAGADVAVPGSFVSTSARKPFSSETYLTRRV
ncbi:hypothetical protein DERF_012251 [Dermatophagoides farinae]|uniref:Uncharacterized protein n=1 Tax=Dermatophagoides farinae TaxID=6954 RepID=A0A922HS69_DERFA|nr:hypothetical protein DERF_012251 [Dermatophagoides farinae]